MTDEQREFVDDVRTVLHDEDAAIHVDLVSLVRIIDAQEAELQTARDTIALYERMIHTMGNYFPIVVDGVLGHVWLQQVAGEWGWNYRSDGPETQKPRHGGGFATPLDAYTALKEAT